MRPPIVELPGLLSWTDVRKNVPFAPGVEPTTGKILRSRVSRSSGPAGREPGLQQRIARIGTTDKKRTLLRGWGCRSDGILVRVVMTFSLFLPLAYSAVPHGRVAKALVSWIGWKGVPVDGWRSGPRQSACP